MNTLEELVRYCNEEHHLGALLLTGEWGCGKTYLIDNNLAEALSSTHFIVRVSFLGVDNVEALNESIRKQYLFVCTPFLSNDPQDYIPLEPVVEDLHDKGVKKKVVLVFDDLNRSQLDWGKFVGTINDYCENKGFTTIVVGDMEAFKAAETFDVMLYKTVKEKTIARTVQYTPDFEAIIHSILMKSVWPSQEYADFLVENEQRINDVFAGDSSDRKSKIRKYHNIRSLSCALQEFYRLYELLTELQVPEIRQYLYSFIAYMIVSRNGINRDGRPSFDNREEEIKLLADTKGKTVEEGAVNELKTNAEHSANVGSTSRTDGPNNPRGRKGRSFHTAQNGQETGTGDNAYKGTGNGGGNNVEVDVKVENTLRKINKTLKENKELKNTLGTVMTSLKEAAVTNHNLAQIIKLISENSTTREEKEEIIRKFANEAKTIDASKALYESLSNDLKKSKKMNITEGALFSAESSKKINETPIYKSQDIMESLDLMHRMMK